MVSLFGDRLTRTQLRILLNRFDGLREHGHNTVNEQVFFLFLFFLFKIVFFFFQFFFNFFFNYFFLKFIFVSLFLFLFFLFSKSLSLKEFARHLGMIFSDPGLSSLLFCNFNVSGNGALSFVEFVSGMCALLQVCFSFFFFLSFLKIKKFQTKHEKT